MLYFRGYKSIFYEEFLKLSVDYGLPLVYPDLSVGSIIYLKRIRTNLFTDFGKGTYDDFKKDFLSYGFDILFDINLFRLYRTVDLGSRFAFTNQGDFRIQFILLQAFSQ